MLLSAQITLIFILTFIHANAEAPPGYVKPAEAVDKNPPKYEYGYNIQDEKGASHGKIETRDGIYALGRYYVQGVDSTHNVQYYADDWGYHPYIEYSNVGPHSKTRTQLLLGVEAVKALASNKFTPNSVQPKQHVTDTISSKLTSRDGKTISASQVSQNQLVVQEQQQQAVLQQPQQILVQQQQPQQILVQQQQPQQILVQQQPQHVVVQQQPQHVVVQQPQVVLEQQHVAVEQQQVAVEQQPQLVQQSQEIQQQQPQQISVEQTQQINQIQQSEQSQQITADESDSIVVEARGQQQQQNFVQQQGLNQQSISQLFQESGQQRLPQPQLQQVLQRQEVSHQQAQNIPQQRLAQPQLEQVQYGQEVSHQFSQQLNFEQLPQPQALTIHNDFSRQNDNQIQDNLIINQQSSQVENADLLEKSSQQAVQQAQANFGGFGSRLNLQGRRKPTYNVQIQENSDKLIQTTRNLINGQDVLNINGALDQKLETTIEATTARAIAANQNLLGVTTVTESSLLNGPIIVADFDDKFISSTENYLNLQQQTRGQIYSTTANTIDSVSTKSFGITEPSSILVTPRPVSTDFLAPITAGIQLQNVDNSRIQLQSAENSQIGSTRSGLQSEGGQKFETSSQRSNIIVEVQKSLPFYLGKFEFEQNPSAVGSVEQGLTKTSQSQSNFQEKAQENIELGKTLLAFPESNPAQRNNLQASNGQLQQQNSNIQVEQQNSNLQLQQQDNVNLRFQQLPEASIRENFVENDQQQAQGIQHQVVQQISNPLVIEKVVEKPVEVTRIVKEPYPVGVPVHVPVQVERRVPVPVTVEKIVEKPVKVTEIVEKRIHVPQPYPVEKIVEKQVHVPYEVTKYVDRPYPVQVPVAQPVPYPVDRVVEKIVKQPYPVAVKVPYEVKVPVTVEKIVEKKVPVPHYIEKQVPVDRIVEKPVPHYIDRPYPVQVGVPVPVAQVYTLQIPTKTIQASPLTTLSAPQPPQAYSGPVKTIRDYQQQQSQAQQLQGQLQRQQLKNQQLLQNAGQGQLQFRQNILAQSSLSSNEYLPPPSNPLPDNGNGYLPPHNCDQHKSFSNENVYYTIQPDDYIGLAPPRVGENDANVPRKLRNPRSNFNSNLRIEYGFKPPLRPSQEIDENGKPIIREEA